MIDDCRFCGSSKVRETWGGFGAYSFVECESCGAQGPPKLTDSEAIAAWNADRDPSLRDDHEASTPAKGEGE